MDWDILESYVVTLIEMIMTGDHTGWDAIKKFKAFKRDMEKVTDIVKKQDKEVS